MGGVRGERGRGRREERRERGGRQEERREEQEGNNVTFQEVLGEIANPQGSLWRGRGSRVNCEKSQAGAHVGRANPDGRVGRAGHSSGIPE